MRFRKPDPAGKRRGEHIKRACPYCGCSLSGGKAFQRKSMGFCKCGNCGKTIPDIDIRW